MSITEYAKEFYSQIKEKQNKLQLEQHK